MFCHILLLYLAQVSEESLVSRCSPSRDLKTRNHVEAACSDQLINIATSMNQNLTDLLAIMQASCCKYLLIELS
jgi:hypothetical protein